MKCCHHAIEYAKLKTVKCHHIFILGNDYFFFFPFFFISGREVFFFLSPKKSVKYQTKLLTHDWPLVD